jgi:hypothetical protein
MEKNPRSKEIRRVCTGLSKEELKKEIRAMEKGKKAPKKCYLCKRPENGTAVLLTPDAKEPYAFATIPLVPVHRKIAGGHTFIFLLCWECALLVGHRARTIGQKRRTQSEKVPAQFLPAGPAKDYYS